jgi:hypothetical protein
MGKHVIVKDYNMKSLKLIIMSIWPIYKNLLWIFMECLLAKLNSLNHAFIHWAHWWHAHQDPKTPKWCAPQGLAQLVQEALLDKQYVATLALGLQPKQGVTRLRAKRQTQESFHMLPRVQRVWGNEPSHSQMNSHVGNWSLEWTPKSS